MLERDFNFWWKLKSIFKIKLISNRRRAKRKKRTKLNSKKRSSSENNAHFRFSTSSFKSAKLQLKQTRWAKKINQQQRSNYFKSSMSKWLRFQMFTLLFISFQWFLSMKFYESWTRYQTRKCINKYEVLNSIKRVWFSIKFFKIVVLATNHRKIERQLLIKFCVQTTIRHAFDETYNHIDSQFAISFQIFQQRCSKLFQDLIRLIIELENEKIEQQYVENATHINSFVLEKITKKIVNVAKLFITMRNMKIIDVFFIVLHETMIIYEYKTHFLDFKSIYWYTQFNFQHSWIDFFFVIFLLFSITYLINKLFSRTSLHCEDFVQLTESRYQNEFFVEIFRVFTHCFSRDIERRIFCVVRKLFFKTQNEIDSLLELFILQNTLKEKIVEMIEIFNQKMWIVRFNHEKNFNDEFEYLHCNWNIQFSWKDNVFKKLAIIQKNNKMKFRFWKLYKVFALILR